MNGVRSTFMRKGYLITALAALLLLAASSGTASAQSVGFVGDTSVTVMEGAGVQGTGIPPLRVTVQRTVSQANPDAFEPSGSLTLNHNAGNGTAGAGLIQDVTIYGPGATPGSGTALPNNGSIHFDPGVTEATLTIIVGQDNADWDDETLVLTLRTNEPGVVPEPGVFRAMIEDNEPKPEFRFSRTSVELTETSTTDLMVTVGVGPAGAPGESRMATALSAITPGDILLSVSPANAVAENGPISISFGANADNPTLAPLGLPDARGRYNIGNINAAVAGSTPAESILVRIMANPDRAGFQDPVIHLTLTDSRSPTAQRGAGGGIADGMAMLNVLSNEPKPTVSFSPTDVNIMEGGSDTSTLLASGQFGAEVGVVKLSVEGDAMVGLYQDGEMLEEMDGYVMVDLGDTNAARLTAMSYEDPDLMDGETAYKMWTIMEADGADIDRDADKLTVMVEGATAVPALPLIGQLLLALFLMAGGSRLYRRRRG